MTQTITAMFDTRTAAQNAVEKLVAAGIARSAIRVLPEAEGSTYTKTGTSYDHGRDEGGFWAGLKDLFIPEEDRYTYSEAMSRGGNMVTVTVDDTHLTRAMDILEEEGSVDLDEREASWKQEGWTGYQAGAGSAGQTAAASSATGAAVPIADVRTSGNSAAYVKSGASDDQVIPIVEERLNVGKRSTEHGRVRIRSYVVEKPVEEQVTLTSEHVHVDRRPVDRAVTAADEALFQERTIEAVERDEQAVVAKEARVVEEVGIQKDVEQRTETVSDTVRRTEVEIDDGRTDRTAVRQK